MPGSPADPVRIAGDGREAVEADAYADFARHVAEGLPAVLVTVIGATGSSPRGPGAAMAVREDGSIAGTVGGGRIEHESIRHALEALADGKPRRLAFDFTKGPGRNLDMACAGTAELFVLPSGGGPKLILCGSGHVARALAPMARAAGYGVTVLDDREGCPRPEDFPEGTKLVSGPYPDRIAEVPFDAERTYVVVVTHAHSRDREALRACLDRPWRYLGMIGSRAKVGQVVRDAVESGADRERLDAVRAPIGLDLGGRTPGEIAVSILAELQAVRHGKERIVPLSESEEEA